MSLPQKNASFRNYQRWKDMGYVYSSNLLYDPDFALYWLWYRHGGWGGAKCLGKQPSQKYINDQAEDWERSSW